MSLTKASFSMITGAPANVLDFGADPTGTTDSTLAFNQALNYTSVITSNSQNNVRQTVIVPAGNYLIGGTVYIQKGMHLKGSGDGPSRIIIPVTNFAGPTFLLGWGLYNGVPTQSGGGLPPSISDLCTEGGSTNSLGYVIDGGATAGANIYNMFITTAPTGLNINNGDLNIYNVIFDNCATGCVVNNSSGISRVVMDACDFYNCNYGFSSTGYIYDFILSNCYFFASKYNDINIGSSSPVKNFNINNCTFTYNTQYNTNTSCISFNASSSDFSVQACNFRNNPSTAIAVSGSNNLVNVFDSIFDGVATNSGYTQGTTANAFSAVGSGHKLNISDNTFINQTYTTQCIYFNALTSTTVNFTNNDWASISASQLITFNGNCSSLFVNALSNSGDSVTPLSNLTTTAVLHAKGNVNWFGPWITSGSVKYIQIPTNGYLNAQVGISAETNTGGSTSYNKSGYYSAVRYADYSGTAIDDYVVITALYAAPNSSYAPAIAPTITLDTPTGGTSGVYSQARYVVISVSNSYVITSTSVDCL